MTMKWMRHTTLVEETESPHRRPERKRPVGKITHGDTLNMKIGS